VFFEVTRKDLPLVLARRSNGGGKVAGMSGNDPPSLT